MGAIENAMIEAEKRENQMNNESGMTKAKGTGEPLPSIKLPHSFAIRLSRDLEYASKKLDTLTTRCQNQAEKINLVEGLIDLHRSGRGGNCCASESLGSVLSMHAEYLEKEVNNTTPDCEPSEL